MTDAIEQCLRDLEADADARHTPMAAPTPAVSRADVEKLIRDWKQSGESLEILARDITTLLRSQPTPAVPPEIVQDLPEGTFGWSDENRAAVTRLLAWARIQPAPDPRAVELAKRLPKHGLVYQPHGLTGDESEAVRGAIAYIRRAAAEQGV